MEGERPKHETTSSSNNTNTTTNTSLPTAATAHSSSSSAATTNSASAAASSSPPLTQRASSSSQNAPIALPKNPALAIAAAAAAATSTPSGPPKNPGGGGTASLLANATAFGSLPQPGTSMSVTTALFPIPPPVTTASSSSSSTASTSLLPASAATAGAAGGAGSMSGAVSRPGVGMGVAYRPAVFDKLEALVRDMQDDHHGVPVRSQKLFLTSIPAAFMGYDLIEWLMDRLSIEDSLEAVHLANLLCQFGYYFPVNDLKNLIVKDDSSLYRFQTPYYWPSQHHTPDNIEYAIYLTKRSRSRNRQRHTLEDYESEAFNNLKKILHGKWDFVQMQAEEQLRVNRDRKKVEKIVMESQEKAYWRVYRPPPGFNTVVESSPVPTREQRVKLRSRTREHLSEEFDFLSHYCHMSRSKASQVIESLIEFTNTVAPFDSSLEVNSTCFTNPWTTDDQNYWVLHQVFVDCPTERRVRKWALSLEDLIIDPLGAIELMAYMKKEFSHENLRFWLSVRELRSGPGSEAKIKKKIKEIWDEFLSPGAKAEINIDGKTMEATKTAMKTPTRFSYDVAAEHVYTLLLKKDCYPRFVRSDHYKQIIENSVSLLNQKKRIQIPKLFQKKTSTMQAPGAGEKGGVTASSSKAGLEQCDIYGADGAGGGPLLTAALDMATCDRGDSGRTSTSETSDLIHSNSRPLRTFQSGDDDSVCPWEVSTDVEDASKTHHHSAPGNESASAAMPRGTSTSGSTRHRRPKSTPQELTPDAKADSTGLERKSSHRSSRHGRRRGEDGGEGHSHRHHHHEHHHGGSRRAKSKSKRKKRATADGQAKTNKSTSSGPDKENVATSEGKTTTSITTTTTTTTTTGTEIARDGGGGTTAGAAAPQVEASSTSSTAALVAAVVPTTTTASSDPSMPSPLRVGGNAGGLTSASPDPVTSSKCTQTKLDQIGPPVIGGGGGGCGATSKKAASPSPSPSHAPLPKSKSADDPVGPAAKAPNEFLSSPNVVEAAEGQNSTAIAEEGQQQQQQQQQPSSSGAQSCAGSGGGGKGSLGGNGTWPRPTTSTEICPWEDEENSNRSSHAPFVKTYATLGYL